MNDTALQGLALYGALLATFAETHSFCDQIVQDSAAARDKDKPGWTGHKACARHVATYTAGQTVTAAAVTTALGYRLPVRAWAAGAAINAVMHYVIDRREPFKEFLRHPLVGQGNYLGHATVQRRTGVVEESGPGTGLFEMDEATHRLVGVGAAAVTVWLALRSR